MMSRSQEQAAMTKTRDRRWTEHVRKESAKTGDSSYYALYLLLALAAAGSATAVIVIRRRRAQ